jgi:hypothetical protein
MATPALSLSPPLGVLGNPLPTDWTGQLPFQKDSDYPQLSGVAQKR